jgi:two-component system NarL family sensor kinase
MLASSEKICISAAIAMSNEIFTTIIGSTLLLVFFSLIIIIAVLKYQTRRRNYLLELASLKNIYQQEILRSQLEMKEQTLHTISQEIHDNIGQVLSLAKLNLNKVLLQEDKPSRDKIIASKELISKAIQDLRDISKTLNSEFVSSTSLAEALRSELAIINKTGEYKANLVIHGLEKPVDSQKQLIIYRILQEAMHNVIKHAKASEIEVILHYLTTSLNIIIKDNGKGFTPSTSQHASGTGIFNMHFRAKLIGATLTLDSKVDHGTILNLSLPLLTKLNSEQ